MSDLSDRTTVVVGASRGLGRGIAAAVGHAVPRPTQRRSFPACQRRRLAEAAMTSPRPEHRSRAASWFWP